MEFPSLGIEVNVGREWVDKENECLSRKTEIDRKMHSFLKPGDDITCGQVGGAFLSGGLLVGKVSRSGTGLF